MSKKRQTELEKSIGTEVDSQMGKGVRQQDSLSLKMVYKRESEVRYLLAQNLSPLAIQDLLALPREKTTIFIIREELSYGTRDSSTITEEELMKLTSLRNKAVLDEMVPRQSLLIQDLKTGISLCQRKS